MKLFDVDGPTLLEDEPDSRTFDLVMKNNPVFVANTAKHYLFIQELADRSGEYLARGRAGFRELLTDFLTGNGTLEQSDWAWDELFAFVRNAQVAEPDLDLDLDRGADVFGPALAGELQARPFDFDLQVQLWGDALAFNQWRVTAEHMPLGEIMRVRRIYSASAKVRRTLSHQPQAEPASAADVLP